MEIVDELDISAPENSYTASGSQAYHPRMLLALLFYCYATGTFFSRKMEAATYESVPVRYVTGNQHPDHDIICTFRGRFLGSLKVLFVQILEIVHQVGLVEVGDVAIDGSKVKANASKHKAMSWKRACELEKQLSEEVAQMMAHAEQADNQRLDADSLPEELAIREERLARIRQTKAMIKQRAEQRYQAEKADYQKKMDDRKEKQGRGFYARRKSTVEPVFGILKHVMGFRQFQLRGFKKVSGEWELLQCAYNIKRMHVLAG